MYRSNPTATVILLTLCFVFLPLVAALSISLPRRVAKLSIPTLATPKVPSSRIGFGLFRRSKVSSLGSSLAKEPSSNKATTKVSGRATEAMYAVPSVFTPTDSRPIVLFDGKCNLCNFGVQLLLDYDRASDDPRGNLRVAALQSRVGRILLDRMSDDVRKMVLAPSPISKRSDDNEEGDEEDENYKSIVVCSPTKTWVNTAAVLRMGRAMKFPFRPIALIAYLIPPFIRNRLYKVVSKTRKLFFGERDECRLWDDNWDSRFVDDAVLGGKGSNDDPFADPNAPVLEEETVAVAADVKIGDKVRVISPTPVMSNYVPSHPEGICVSGCIGRVVGEAPMMVEFDEGELFGSSSSEEKNDKADEKVLGKKIRAYVRSDQITEVSFE